ncbi:hypothetical protein JJL56_01655 [Azospirillum sp. YIM DDC1]|uniref:Uncharacterized protein n=1 Tax=Azospirillum aestuarii TaxID=2802052 RepID=A0ABS1HS72_9PROT|nr:hypothetical protein [Azospirillum aestuarii]MBK4717566.1 hypothetical protein [Azospirillum aestuarii]
MCDLNLVARVYLSGKALKNAGAFCEEAQDAVLSAVFDVVHVWSSNEDAIVDCYCEMADADASEHFISIDHDPNEEDEAASLLSDLRELVDQAIEEAIEAAEWEDEIEGLTKGKPDYDSGCYYNSTGVEVWPNAVRFTTLPVNGGRTERVVSIGDDTYAAIEVIMDRYAYGDANRVIQVQRLLRMD